MPCEFLQGAAADLASKDTDRAADKFAALAYAQVVAGTEGRGDRSRRKGAREQQGREDSIPGGPHVRRGGLDRQSPRAGRPAWRAEIQVEPQAYAKIVDGEAALKAGDARQAIKVLTEANALLDTWIGHFDLGRAYLEAGAVPAGRFRVRPLHQTPRPKRFARFRRAGYHGRF